MKMAKEWVRRYEAIAILISTMLGAGILAIPYSFSKTGLVIGLAMMGLIVTVTTVKKLMTAEIILRTETTHQLPGYIGIYLGPIWKRLVSTAFILSIFGALLAYMIGQGQVLSSLFPGTSAFTWSLIWHVGGSIAVFFGLTFIKRTELILTLLVMGIVLFIGYLSFNHITFDHYVYMNPSQWIIPYGVLLFSYGGVVAIPEMREELKGQEKFLKPSIYTGAILISIIYLVFSVMILGVTGGATTEVATIGLSQKLGNAALVIGNILSFFTMGTCFLTLSYGLIEMFKYDFGIPNPKAWLITIGVPFLIFIAGLRDFIQIISLVGGVLLSLQTISVVLAFWKAQKMGTRKPEFTLGHLPIVGTSIIVVSLLGSFLVLLNVL